MRGITFDAPRPLTQADPNRMDPVCFVGFVTLRTPGQLPPAVARWLRHNGWAERAEQDWDVPVPLESWEAFMASFSEQGRIDGQAQVAGTALGEVVALGPEQAAFGVSLDGVYQEVALPAGVTTPEEIAFRLDAGLTGIETRLERSGTAAHLVLRRQEQRSPGRLTAYANPELGFPRAVAAANQRAGTYLAAAVRSFFAQGGRKCYVVPMGDPLPLDASEAAKLARLARLLFSNSSPWDGIRRLAEVADAYFPGLGRGDEAHARWHGVEHLLGLPDAAMLVLPDLPELLSSPPQSPPPATPPESAEVFVECSTPAPTARQGATNRWQPPRCGVDGYRVWSRILTELVGFLRRRVRDVHLVAGVPLPMGADRPPTPELDTAFVQLAYPWLRSDAARQLPGGVEPPGGILAGILAANALGRGTYRTAAGSLPRGTHDTLPARWASGDLGKRLCLFARDSRGIALTSDTTPSADPAYRQGAISRTVALLLRAARNQGRTTVFEPLSESTWRAVERSLGATLGALYDGGGLRGASPEQAFQVTCDRSTMTQNDLDNGRLVADVSFQPAAPIARIHVALALDRSGVSLAEGTR